MISVKGLIFAARTELYCTLGLFNVFRISAYTFSENSIEHVITQAVK